MACLFLCLCPSVCLSVRPSVFPSVRPSVCLSLSVCLSVCMSVCPSVCPSVRPSVRPCLSARLAPALNRAMSAAQWRENFIAIEKACPASSTMALLGHWIPCFIFGNSDHLFKLCNSHPHGYSPASWLPPSITSCMITEDDLHFRDWCFQLYRQLFLAYIFVFCHFFVFDIY
jgi:hypothetical protein